MPVTLICGKLGAGKSLVAVGRIRECLLEGRRIATNLDLTLERLLPAKARKVDCIRLPDKPTVRELELLGQGNESMDERRNGVIVLDELATWLNARQWGDKDRKEVIDWLRHSRKFGWDVVFITQHIGDIDKQVREALVEYHCVCRRLDRLKVPLIGWLLRLVTGGIYNGYMPKIHVGILRYGTTPDAIVAERWIYLGRDLYGGYNTRQVFSDSYIQADSHAKAGVGGAFSYLTPWHLVGRHVKPWRERLRAFLGWAPRPRPRREPAAHLAPLLRLEPELRIQAVRHLVRVGKL